MKILIVTDNESDFEFMNKLFNSKSEWVYRHEQLKHSLNVDFIVFIPSTKQMQDFDIILKTVVNKGFPIVDMIGI